MGSVPKSTRSCKKSRNGDFDEQGDRISSLPVGILSCILSFLPTRYAVRTSILSKRWRELWTFVPNLEFIHHTTDANEGHQFMDFVDRVLILHNVADIKKFSLEIKYENYNPYCLNSWICYAIKHNVEQLYLDVSMKQLIELPRNLFISFKLRALKLGGGFSFHFPVPMFLPSLKVLHLDRLDFVNDDFMKTLLSGCPLLEELEILSVKGGKIQRLYICSSTLKKLKIRVTFYARKSILKGIVIRAPLLEGLHISNFSSDDLDVGELPSLVEADINISPSSMFQEDNNYSQIMVQLLRNICHVKRLKLSCYKNLVPHIYLLAFDNLVHLEVIIYRDGWHDLHYLLENAPKLNLLALKIENKTICFPPLHGGHLSEKVPKCLSSSLEAIEFGRFGATEDEMKIIEYFLKNAIVLKKLTILSSIDAMDKRLTVLQELLMFPRGSNACQVAFC